MDSKTIDSYQKLISKINIDSVNLWKGGLIGLPITERIVLPMGEFIYPDSVGFNFIWYPTTYKNNKVAIEQLIESVSLFNLDFDNNLTSCFAFSKKMIPEINPENDLEGWASQKDKERYIYPDTILVFIRNKGVWKYVSASIINSREEYDTFRNYIITSYK